MSIEQEFACMVRQKFDRRKEVSVVNVINFLFEQGWVDNRLPKKAVIKQFYFDQLRANGGNVRDAILDCMDCYDVSESFVKRLIYCKELKG